jgi:hypothetical protein
VPSHALVGVYTTANRKQAAFLETTLLDRASAFVRAGSSRGASEFENRIDHSLIGQRAERRRRCLGSKALLRPPRSWLRSTWGAAAWV